MLPLAEAARAAFPARELDADETALGPAGRRTVAQRRRRPRGLGPPVAAFAPDGTLVALVSETGTGTARPLVVLAPA